jgi:hypothetical protein
MCSQGPIRQTKNWASTQVLANLLIQLQELKMLVYSIAAILMIIEGLETDFDCFFLLQFTTGKSLKYLKRADK